MGGAATATGMGGAKHLTRNDTGAELVADSRGPGAARRGSPRPGPLDSLHFSFIKRPCRCVSVPAPGLGIIEPCLLFLGQRTK
jgi:hypothetical protein